MIDLTAGKRHKWVDTPHGRVRKPIDWEHQEKPPEIKQYVTPSAPKVERQIVFEKLSLWSRFTNWFFNMLGR